MASSGNISIRCDRPGFGDPQLLSVMDPLRKLDDLKILNLDFTGITDDSLRQLRSLDSLEYLGLCETGVTDAGIEHLVEMRHLDELDLRNTNVTEAGVARLQFARPDCFILR